jgi:pantoate--beta-alanine ligase
MSARIVDTASGFRAACDEVRARGQRLGIVPTMGALHRGHVALIEEAARRADSVAVTIFVNPTQFGPNEDFSRYPRSLEQDILACERAGAKLVFAPAVSEMYPAGERTRVTVSGLTDALCGRSRPGHFEGVTTIVAKLFAVSGPAVAVFGRKDYQQLKVIERMVRDLLLPIEVVAHRIVRESDGLALSSRNAYLSPQERERALAIPRSLSEAVASFDTGEKNAGTLRQNVLTRLEEAGLRPDYVEVADADTIEPFAAEQRIGERALLALAAFAGTTRLIDNVVFGEDPPPIA